MTNVADKLREAKALIERGWTRGEYCRGGRYCLMGAIQAATAGHPESYNETTRIAERLIRCVTGGLTTSWNDRQASKKPVLAVIDKAIELAEQQSA